jgi:hypothetical protein
VVSSNSDDAEEAKDEDLAATEWVSNGAVRKGRGGRPGGASMPLSRLEQIDDFPPKCSNPLRRRPRAPCGSE